MASLGENGGCSKQYWCCCWWWCYNKPRAIKSSLVRPLSGEEFILSFWIISHFLFRHLSCSRSWRIRTGSGSWLSCKRDRRANVFLRRSRSWRSPPSLQRRRRDRARRRRRRRARPRLLEMLLLHRLLALSRTPAAATAAAASVPLVSRLRKSRQLLQQTHSQKSESSGSAF